MRGRQRERSQTDKTDRKTGRDEERDRNGTMRQSFTCSLRQANTKIHTHRTPCTRKKPLTTADLSESHLLVHSQRVIHPFPQKQSTLANVIKLAYCPPQPRTSGPTHCGLYTHVVSSVLQVSRLPRHSYLHNSALLNGATKLG